MIGVLLTVAAGVIFALGFVVGFRLSILPLRKLSKEHRLQLGEWLDSDSALRQVLRQ